MEPRKLPIVNANAISVRLQPISSPMGFTNTLSTGPYIDTVANAMIMLVKAMPHP